MPPPLHHPASIKAKICGLRTAEDIAAAIAGEAAFIGFMIFPKSPRRIEPRAAEALAASLPPTVKSVAVLVDPDDQMVSHVAPWADFLQLHGTETVQRTRAIKALAAKPVIKALGISKAHDLEDAAQYQGIADILLFDAKPPTSRSDVRGGHGIPFDWTLLANANIQGPWMLSAGLTAQNVQQAIGLTGAKMVDVSSGVEKTRGTKSPEMIKAFLKAVKETSAK